MCLSTIFNEKALPPYSPNLNPIERLWKILRETTIYNRYYVTYQNFREEVSAFFTEKIHRLQQRLKERINDSFQVIRLNPIKLG
ncbi:MAG: transposase [Verrucomicrobiota bacterium]|nr:transposase [Verrucomicrobiota bacterium]